MSDILWKTLLANVGVSLNASRSDGFTYARTVYRLSAWLSEVTQLFGFSDAAVLLSLSASLGSGMTASKYTIHIVSRLTNSHTD